MSDLDDAHDALDRYPADDDWLHGEHGVLDTLAPGWRDPDKLAEVVAQADRLLADQPLPSWVTDRLVDLDERDQHAIVRLRFTLALTQSIRGAVAGALADLDLLLADDRTDYEMLAEWLRGVAPSEWAEVTAAMLPTPSDLPAWLDRDQR